MGSVKPSPSQPAILALSHLTPVNRRFGPVHSPLGCRQCSARWGRGHRVQRTCPNYIADWLGNLTANRWGWGAVHRAQRHLTAGSGHHSDVPLLLLLDPLCYLRLPHFELFELSALFSLDGCSVFTSGVPGHASIYQGPSGAVASDRW
jgi:hypothetical protein